MAWQHDLDAHFSSALHHQIEILYLKPEQHAVAVGPVGTIADGTVMVLDFKTVQLQDEVAILYQLLIVLAAVGSTAAEKALIPQAAGFDIRNTDERLGTHGLQVSRGVSPRAGGAG